MKNNKGFAVSAALYSLVIIFMFFVSLILLLFNSTNNLIAASTNDIIDNEYRIYNIEDFIILKDKINGNDFLPGLNVYLESDLDFSNASSYKKSDSTSYGDINGNNIITGLLEELTTSYGMLKGIDPANEAIINFDGKNHTIKNLRLLSDNDIYLFNNIKGEINNLILINANINNSDTGPYGLYYGLNIEITNCYVNTNEIINNY